MGEKGNKLKCKLLAEGISVDGEAKKAILKMSHGHLATLADYPTTAGITLFVEKTFWVNAPVSSIQPEIVKNPEFVLTYADGCFTLNSKEETLSVEIVPTAEFDDKRASNGDPFQHYAVTHVDRVRISPVKGCSCDCRFCDMPYSEKYQLRDEQIFIESINEALRDPLLSARHVLISGGTPEKSEISSFNALCRSVVEAFPKTPIDLMAIPNGEYIALEELLEIPFHEYSLNIELYDQKMAERYIPKKAALMLESRWSTLEEVVKRTNGKVRSMLIVGIEPLEETVKGVEELAKRGVTPVLSPFRPFKGTRMENDPPPSEEDLYEVLQKSLEIADKYGMTIGPECEPCKHNVLGI